MNRMEIKFFAISLGLAVLILAITMEGTVRGHGIPVTRVVNLTDLDIWKHGFERISNKTLITEAVKQVNDSELSERIYKNFLDELKIRQKLHDTIPREMDSLETVLETLIEQKELTQLSQ